MSFNPKLFAKKSDYQPHVSYSSEIRPLSYLKDTVEIHLDNESSLYIPSFKILNFLLTNNVSLQNNIFSFPIVFDYEGNPQTERTYDEWVSHSEGQDSFKLEDLEPGSVYLFDDERTSFVYLGCKYVISYRIIDISGEIKLSKVQKKYFGYTLYSDEKEIKNSSFYDGRIISLTSKHKIIKELDSVEFDFVSLLNFVKISTNSVYFEDVKPSFKNFELEFKEFSEEEIFSFKTESFKFIDVWHKLQSGYFLKHHFFLHDDYVFGSDNDEFFKISKGNLYSENFVYQGEFYLNSYSSSSDPRISGLLYYSNNTNFRLAPKNFFRPVLKVL